MSAYGLQNASQLISNDSLLKLHYMWQCPGMLVVWLQLNCQWPRGKTDCSRDRGEPGTTQFPSAYDHAYNMTINRGRISVQSLLSKLYLLKSYGLRRMALLISCRRFGFHPTRISLSLSDRDWHAQHHDITKHLCLHVHGLQKRVRSD